MSFVHFPQKFHEAKVNITATLVERDLKIWHIYLIIIKMNQYKHVLRWEAGGKCFSEIKPTDPQLYNSLTVNKYDSTTGHESHESSIANQVRSHFPLQMPYKYSPGHL